MQHHPLTPMTDANLVRVLQRQTTRRVGLVGHEVVRRGAEAIAQRFDALAAQGVRIAIVDAIADEDLMALGAAAAGLPVLTAGSGVALGLPQNWVRSGRLAPGAATDALPAAAGLRAIVSGSCSRATNEQVEAFRQAGGAAFRVEPRALAAGDDVVDQALAWARPRLAAGPVLVHATAGPEDVQAAQAALGVEQAGHLVEQALADIGRGLVEAGVRQLVVAGGETSGAVVQALGVQQMVIGAQIDPGVPWTHAVAHACGGVPLHLALKSGNFGSAGFFTRAFEALA